MTSLLFYQTGFVKALRSSILINAPLCYLECRVNFKQISYLTTLLLKIARKKKYQESLLIVTPRIVLALTTSFIKLQFSYCPIIWILCLKKCSSQTKQCSSKISARLPHQDYVSKFIAFLVKVNEKSLMRVINTFINILITYHLK